MSLPANFSAAISTLKSHLYFGMNVASHCISPARIILSPHSPYLQQSSLLIKPCYSATISTSMSLGQACTSSSRDLDRKIYRCQEKHGFDLVTCNAAFSQKSSLKRHQLKKREKSEATTFVHCSPFSKQRRSIHLTSKPNTSFARPSVAYPLISSAAFQRSMPDGKISQLS